ncbi:hypothetical protein JCM30760_18470 [Thiomicrorhabdus hydrogeniphila]
MKNWLNKLTIKQKMRFGFGVIWAVLAIITIQAAANLYVVRSNMSDVVTEQQPVALDAMESAFLLEKSMNDLSMYILMNDEELLNKYEKGIDSVQKNMAKAQKNLTGSGVEENILKDKYKVLDQHLAQLNGLVTDVKSFQKNRADNFPAFKYVNNNMLTVAKQIQQIISMMIDSELSDLLPQRKKVISDLLALQKNWLNVTSSLRGYIGFRSQVMSDATDNYLDQFETVMKRLNNQKQVELTIEEEDGLSNLEGLYEAYREHFMVVKGIHGGDKWRMDVWFMSNKIQPLFHTLDKELMSISELAVSKVKATSENVLDLSLNSIILLILLSGIGQIAGMIISNRVTRSVVTPIQEISAAMKDISEGEGDLTRRLPVNSSDEMGQLAQHFNLFVEKIHQMLSEVSSTIRELEVSSCDLLKITTQAKSGAQQQLSASGGLSASMVEMTQKSKSVEDHSHNASRATNEATERVKQGGEMVLNTAGQIQQLTNGMDEMTASVKLLREDSESIGTVVNVIREIAEQTNLLSLNAAIEAARAGEHGRGFAVVADEVRGLAQRTQDSTRQIEQIIEKIRHATLTTADVVEAGQSATKASCDAISKTKDALQPVIILMDDINKMSQQMSSAAHSQSVLAQEINQNITQIHDVTEMVANGSTGTEQAGNHLQVLADKLERLVHQFKI